MKPEQISREVRSFITQLEPSLKGRRVSIGDVSRVLKEHGLYDGPSMLELAQMARRGRRSK